MKANEKESTILIVDDEPTNVQALAKLLKNDYRIQVANNGEKALAIARGSKQPDLILLDIQMEGMDGYEVCRQLKEVPLTNTIPVIFVTGQNTVSDEEKGFKLGAVDYISKPFYPTIVRARVGTHMSLKLKTDLLEQIAMLDGLTGIPNRRYFDERFQKEGRRALRDKLPFSVIMMDIDHFKGFNDNYGHGAGDNCLQKVARALANTLLRPADIIARYGGEEFVALLPNTNSEGAGKMAEDLRSAVESLAVINEYSSAARVVTLSLGVATLDTDGDETMLSELLKQADDALYKAKEGGRNRFVFAK
ncbi:diguanylate cyclase [Halomonas vilamensis]|uniref:diguanylate cyclase n=1 Tax=Vreelandella vilamensis TaxID=531309 RepID=A0ABU1H7M4_9GAMM|nr:diguanylate cyclase [Halomonas vilamensis]MDR5900305.1 diguanylate cyclase [Halomonas vilamensis]